MVITREFLFYLEEVTNIDIQIMKIFSNKKYRQFLTSLLLILQYIHIKTITIIRVIPAVVLSPINRGSLVAFPAWGTITEHEYIL